MGREGFELADEAGVGWGEEAGVGELLDFVGESDEVGGDVGAGGLGGDFQGDGVGWGGLGTFFPLNSEGDGGGGEGGGGDKGAAGDGFHGDPSITTCGGGRRGLRRGTSLTSTQFPEPDVGMVEGYAFPPSRQKKGARTGHGAFSTDLNLA